MYLLLGDKHEYALYRHNTVFNFGLVCKHGKTNICQNLVMYRFDFVFRNPFQILFSVDNGEGEILTTYTPPAKNMLCNGKWHSIKAVKAKNVVTLYVDDVFTYPGIGEAGVSSTDTNDRLYIGGVPGINLSSFIIQVESYTLCISV